MINTILNIPLFSPITTVDYVSWLFFICFFYAIVGLFFLRSKFRHQENRKKLMYILVFGECVLIGASLVSAYCANSSFKIGIYTLPFVLIVSFIAGNIAIVRYIVKTQRWINANRGYATLLFKEEWFVREIHRIVILEIDGVPYGKGLIYWAMNKCLIASGKHQIKLAVKVLDSYKSKPKTKGYTQDVLVNIAPMGKYIIEEDREKQCLNVRSLFKVVTNSTEVPHKSSSTPPT